jgi:hypothetical protein
MVEHGKERIKEGEKRGGRKKRLKTGRDFELEGRKSFKPEPFYLGDRVVGCPKRYGEAQTSKMTD